LLHLLLLEILAMAIVAINAASRLRGGWKEGGIYNFKGSVWRLKRHDGTVLLVELENNRAETVLITESPQGILQSLTLAPNRTKTTTALFWAAYTMLFTRCLVLQILFQKTVNWRYMQCHCMHMVAWLWKVAWTQLWQLCMEILTIPFSTSPS